MAYNYNFDFSYVGNLGLVSIRKKLGNVKNVAMNDKIYACVELRKILEQIVMLVALKLNYDIPRRSTLHNTINILESSIPEQYLHAEHIKSMHIIKTIGNKAAHSDGGNWGYLLHQSLGRMHDVCHWLEYIYPLIESREIQSNMDISQIDKEDNTDYSFLTKVAAGAGLASVILGLITWYNSRKSWWEGF